MIHTTAVLDCPPTFTYIKVFHPGLGRKANANPMWPHFSMVTHPGTYYPRSMSLHFKFLAQNNILPQNLRFFFEALTAGFPHCELFHPTEYPLYLKLFIPSPQERPPPVPPSRTYTVTGNSKISYPQTRVMKMPFPEDGKGNVNSSKFIRQ